MNTIHASRDPGRYAVDYGHEVAAPTTSDETSLLEQEVISGIRRAEDDTMHAALDPAPEQEGTTQWDSPQPDKTNHGW